MDAEHPPVEVLRLGARAAAIVGLYAGAVRLISAVPTATLDPIMLLWMALAGVFFSATVIALTLPRHEAAAGAALVASAAVATIASGAVRTGEILGWAHGYALLFLAAGLFFMSSWAWARRDAARQPRPYAHEDADSVEGS